MGLVSTVTLNPAVDATTSVDRVVSEKKLRCAAPQRYPGGGGLNAARVIHRLGGRVSAAWSCGGPIGELLSGLLDREGLHHDPVPTQGTSRENFIVYEEASGEQYRFGMPGPEMVEQDREAWSRWMEELEPAPDYLVLSGSLPPGAGDGFYAELLDRAPRDARVVLDTSGEALRQALDRGVFLVKPNLGELSALAGRRFQRDADAVDAGRELIDRGAAEVVVVSVGRGGALVITGDGCDRIGAPAVQAASKVGAGDSMVGGLVHGLAEGRPLADAVRLGVAAGTAAVMTEGTELCHRQDVERLYAEMIGSTGT